MQIFILPTCMCIPEIFPWEVPTGIKVTFFSVGALGSLFRTNCPREIVMGQCLDQRSCFTANFCFLLSLTNNVKVLPLLFLTVAIVLGLPVNRPSPHVFWKLTGINPYHDVCWNKNYLIHSFIRAGQRDRAREYQILSVWHLTMTQDGVILSLCATVPDNIHLTHEIHQQCALKSHREKWWTATSTSVD